MRDLHEAGGEAARSVLELLGERRPVAMLTTTVDGQQTSRPLHVADVDERCLSFLVDIDAAWMQPVLHGTATVHVIVADEPAGIYVAVNGVPSVSSDPDEIERRWATWAHAFFHGPDDTRLVLLRIEVTGGQYWEGPSGLVGRVGALIHAALNGVDDVPPDHGPVLGT